MTTTNDEHDWELFGGYRPIPNWSGYAMSVKLDVWSMPRQVRCKGGGTKRNPAKQLKVSDGRVTLCHDGRQRRYHVERELYPRVFPDQLRPQVRCHNGHPLIAPVNPDIFGSLAPIVQPRLAYWGTGNRICKWCCCEPPDTFPADNRYSLQFGVGEVSDYTGLPAQPKLLGRRDGDGDRDELAELEWGEHGFIISNYPW